MTQELQQLLKKRHAPNEADCTNCGSPHWDLTDPDGVDCESSWESTESSNGVFGLSFDCLECGHQVRLSHIKMNEYFVKNVEPWIFQDPDLEILDPR